MAERRPREPFSAAPAGARRVRVGRIFPSGGAPAANDNRTPVLVRLRRLAYGAAVAAAGGWLLWSNL